MRERADGIGAVLTVTTQAEHGTTVEVNWTAPAAAKS
jgi:signal transduction histidine kinase